MIAEDIEGRAAQAPQPGQPAEGGEHPGAEGELADAPGGRVGPGQEGRGEVEAQAEVALELAVHRLAEARIAEQAGHFVLVLVGQQLEVMAQYRFGEALAAQRGFGRTDAGHQVGVATGVGGVLVGGEHGRPAGDAVVQGFGAYGDHRRRFHLPFDGAQVHGGPAAPQEGLAVHVHRRAVEFDGLVQAGGADRHPALLPGVAEQEQVGGDGVAEQAGGQELGIQEYTAIGAHCLHDGGLHLLQGELPVRVAGELGRGCFGAIDHAAGAPDGHLGQGVDAGGDHHVTADHRVGFAGGDAHGVEIFRPVGDADVAEHGAALLGQAGHVEHGDALAVQVGGHADQGADGDHPGATHAGDENAPGLAGGRQGGLGQGGEALLARLQGAPLTHPAAFDGDETRAEAVHARVVLVAGRLVDLAFAPELGFHRQDGHAVGFPAAVTAALAHRLVDEDAGLRVGEGAALPASALLGGTGLVEDQGRHAGHGAQFALDHVQLVALADRDAVGNVGHMPGPVGAVGDQHDGVHPFALQLAQQLWHRQVAVHRLAAGHGHGVVEEDLVGDAAGRRPAATGAIEGCYRLADGQQARVEIGAVAQVGKDVGLVDEGRLANPGHAFTAHVGEGAGLAVGHEGGHVVATDAGHGAAAFGHHRGGVVGAAWAEGGHPVDGEDAAAEGGLLGLQEGQAGLDAIGGEEAPDAGSDDPGDHGRGQLPGGGEQPFAVVYGGTAVRAQGGEQRPFPLLVELADNAGAHVLAPVVELFLELVFEELALLLDHQDLVQPFGEVAHPFGLQGPHHAHLVEADADLGGECFVNAQVVEGLAHVQVALAAGDDAQPGLGRVDDDAVEAVGPAVSQGGVELGVEQALLLHQRRVGPADVEPVRGQGEVVGDLRGDAQRIHVHRGRGFHRVGQGLEGHPAAGIARQGPAMHAEVEIVLHTGRGQHRHHHRLEEVVGLVGQGGRLGGVVVAGDHQHPAVLRAAGGVGVAEHVATAVHARPLAVPHAEHALHAGLG